ncbi:hypothetical protein LCGC14_3102760, partial [marine sediment metagenome]
ANTDPFVKGKGGLGIVPPEQRIFTIANMNQVVVNISVAEREVVVGGGARSQCLHENTMLIDEIVYGGTGEKRATELREGAANAAQHLSLVKNQAIRLLETARVSQLERMNMVDTMMWGMPDDQDRLPGIYEHANRLVPAFDWGSINEAYRAWKTISNEIVSAGAKATRYSKYSLPGGTQYGEVLLTLPDIGTTIASRKLEKELDEAVKEMEAIEGLQRGQTDNPENPTNSTAYTVAFAKAHRITMELEELTGVVGGRRKGFRSGHWAQANVVVHMRLSEHADADGKGVLVLSETAGAAKELGEAIIINVNNQEEIVEALEEALAMPEEEQIERNRTMQKRLQRYN